MTDSQMNREKGIDCCLMHSITSVPGGSFGVSLTNLKMRQAVPNRRADWTTADASMSTMSADDATSALWLRATTGLS